MRPPGREGQPVPPVAARRSDCPECGGALGEPVSGDLHCYVECARCRTHYELDDPRLAPGPG